MESLKDMVQKDIYGVFLELDDFAEWHVVAGKKIKCVLDADETSGPAKKSFSQSVFQDEFGYVKADYTLFANTKDLPCRQSPGQTITVDNRQFVIIAWNEAMGMAELSLVQAQVI